MRRKSGEKMPDRPGKDDGTMLAKVKITASTILQPEEVKAKRLNVFHTDDFRAERSKMMLDLWADEEYTCCMRFKGRIIIIKFFQKCRINFKADL